MVYEYVGHKKEYSTISVSVVDFEYFYEERSMAQFCCSPFVPDPDIRMVFGTHLHDSLELLYIREGSMHVEVNQERIPISAGDIMIVNPFDIHGGRMLPIDQHVASSCLMLELKTFMLEYKNSCADPLITMLLEGEYRFPVVLHADEAPTRQIAALIGIIKADYNQSLQQVTPMLECGLMSKVYSLLAVLFELAQPVHTTVPRRHDPEFIRSINQYVSVHYTEALTVKKLCAELGFSERNFYRLFQQNYGTTFVDYLREFRIQRAAIDYRNSDLSVCEIAAAVGFTDYCYFSRSFKNVIGMPPARYFRQYSSK